MAFLNSLFNRGNDLLVLGNTLIVLDVDYFHAQILCNVQKTGRYWYLNKGVSNKFKFLVNLIGVAQMAAGNILV